MLELAGFHSDEEFIAAIAPQTAIVTIMAGDATRWSESLETAGRGPLEQYGVPVGTPRPLVYVENLLPEYFSGDRMPSVAVNLEAMKGLGTQVVVLRPEHPNVVKKMDGRVPGRTTYVDRIKREVLLPLEMAADTHVTLQRPVPLQYGIRKTGPDFRQLGHADALIQVSRRKQPDGSDSRAALAIRNSKYLVTKFNNDLSSRDTAVDSLLLRYVLDKYGMGEQISVILPTADMESKYPVYVNNGGIPLTIGHNKVEVIRDRSGEAWFGPNNIGVRVYRTQDIMDILDDVDSKRTEETYYDVALLPNGEFVGGPDSKRTDFPPETIALEKEFILDWVDLALMRQGKARQFCVADPEEIRHNMKEVRMIPDFVADMRKIYARRQARAARPVRRSVAEAIQGQGSASSGVIYQHAGN
jgi:hypothetical protein